MADVISEVPWDDLDPGIVGVVRELHSLGFETIDSGDGRHKGTLPGYGPEGPYAYSEIPHVVILPSSRSHLAEVMEYLYLWAEGRGLEGVSVQADIFRNPHSDPPNQVEIVVIVGGDDIYGWGLT